MTSVSLGASSIERENYALDDHRNPRRALAPGIQLAHCRKLDSPFAGNSSGGSHHQADLWPQRTVTASLHNPVAPTVPIDSC